MEYQKINIQHGWDDGIYHLQISTKLKQHPWHGIDIHWKEVCSSWGIIGETNHKMRITRDICGNNGNICKHDYVYIYILFYTYIYIHILQMRYVHIYIQVWGFAKMGYPQTIPFCLIIFPSNRHLWWISQLATFEDTKGYHCGTARIVCCDSTLVCAFDILCLEMMKNCCEQPQKGGTIAFYLEWWLEICGKPNHTLNSPIWVWFFYHPFLEILGMFCFQIKGNHPGTVLPQVSELVTNSSRFHWKDGLLPANIGISSNCECKLGGIEPTTTGYDTT